MGDDVVIGKKKGPPGKSIQPDNIKRWMVVIAMGNHSEDAVKMGTDGFGADVSVITLNDKSRFNDTEGIVKAFSSVTGDLLDEMEKFATNKANKGVKNVIDIHVCGPMHACTLIGVLIEKIRHRMFNDYDVMTEIGKISCFDRTIGSKIEIDYQEI